jgi:hypothetical protein
MSYCFFPLFLLKNGNTIELIVLGSQYYEHKSPNHATYSCILLIQYQTFAEHYEQCSTIDACE